MKSKLTALCLVLLALVAVLYNYGFNDLDLASIFVMDDVQQGQISVQ